VRRAVNDAFDPQASATQEGRAYASTCQVLPPNFPGYRTACLYASGGVTGLDRARSLVRSAGAAGARVTVWVPGPLTERGRYMASVLDSLGFRASVNAVPVVKDADVYFSKVSESRVGAQTGFGAWGADYPSAAGFIPPLLSCAAIVPASPEQTTNLTGFCDRSIDAEMAAPPPFRRRILRLQRCSGNGSSVRSSRRRLSCRRSTGATSTSSPSESATTSTTRSGAPCSTSSGSSRHARSSGAEERVPSQDRAWCRQAASERACLRSFG
jgi:hypothetical protein